MQLESLLLRLPQDHYPNNRTESETSPTGEIAQVQSHPILLVKNDELTAL
jgi:hypothetical protein